MKFVGAIAAAWFDGNGMVIETDIVFVKQDGYDGAKEEAMKIAKEKWKGWSNHTVSVVLM